MAERKNIEEWVKLSRAERVKQMQLWSGLSSGKKSKSSQKEIETEFKAYLDAQADRFFNEATRLRRRRIRRSNLQPALLVAAALLMGFISLPIVYKTIIHNPQLSERQEVSLNLNHVSKNIHLEAGSIIRDKDSQIKIISGSIHVKTRLSPGKWAMQVEQAVVDIDIKKKVNFEIKHPKLSLFITGTRFTVNFKKETGFVELYEGRLKAILLKPYNGSKTVYLKPGSRLTYNANGYDYQPPPRNEPEEQPQERSDKPVVKEISPDSKPNVKSPEPAQRKAGPKPLLQRFELQDGSFHYGTIKKVEPDTTTIVTTGGKEIIIPHSVLKSTTVVDE